MIPFDVPQAPYMLLIVGLFSSLTSGLAFGAVLKGSVENYLGDRNPEHLKMLRELPLQLPFAGICMGICLFLASSVEIFAFSTKLSYAIAFPLTVLIGVLVWFQLMQILSDIERKGIQALGPESADGEALEDAV
ncbi:MAG: hypothetical protein AAGA75_21370 [Cyanobacteria bacterium P01_E01_bin.6]